MYYADIFPKVEVGEERGDTLVGKLALRRNILTMNGTGWKAHRKVRMR